MPSKTVTQQVGGELTDANGKTYNVQLELTVKPLYVDERATPIRRVVEECTLLPTSGQVVPDGTYTLTYVFDGTPQKETVRVADGGFAG
jgi:hypothetical protein